MVTQVFARLVPKRLELASTPVPPPSLFRCLAAGTWHYQELGGQQHSIHALALSPKCGMATNCLCCHPSRLLALFLPEARLHQPLTATAVLTALTCLLTMGPPAGVQEQGPCLMLPSDNLWSPLDRALLGLPSMERPQQGRWLGTSGGREGLLSPCCSSFRLSLPTVSPCPHISSSRMGGGRVLSGLWVTTLLFLVVFFLLFLWRPGGALEVTNKRGQEARGGWQPSWGKQQNQHCPGAAGTCHEGGVSRGRSHGARAAHSPRATSQGQPCGNAAAL